ncbi:MAG TPA: DedA family protein [Alphaproteobacteria bacterium]|jgi:membrane-associated protein|nr:DedA family protein [Alphaproteobacteria bacterium]
MHFLIDIFLHLDKNLALVISKYGTLTYLLLFGIIFMETGFVVTPFLPGDSLLFAGGALSAISSLQIWPVYLVFLTAATLGDTVNYWIGYKVGPRISEREGRFIKKEYFVQAQEFYAKHGNMAIVLARFVPIVRTFAPFVAGIAKMSYKHFIIYNVIGGFLWVTAFTWSGYFFGNLPFVKENFHYIVLVIIFLSILPVIYEFLKSRKKISSGH